MCQFETISVSSRKCYWADPAHGGTPHIWQKYTVMRCREAEKRGPICSDAEQTESPNNLNGESAGSTTLKPCHLCDKLTIAEDARSKALAQAEGITKRAEEVYAAACKEAYQETREVCYRFLVD